MTTTMLYDSRSDLENGMRLQQEKPSSGSMSEKQKHRPKSLHLGPFDAGELSQRLSVWAAHDDEVDPMSQPKSAQAPNFSYHLKGRAASVETGSASPRTIPSKDPSPKDKSFAPKLHVRKDSTASTHSRRGSLFDRIAWRGSNYDEKEEQATQAAPTPAYRHVPKVAAAQFARTTTVETVSQKAQVVKHTKPAPGPGSMSNATMSPQDYNKAYRRAQSLCSGRPLAGNNGFPLTVLETTAEVDEEPSQLQRKSLQAQGHWNKNFDLGSNHHLNRRMSTGNMFAKADNRLQVDTSGQFQRRNSSGLNPNRRGSQASHSSSSPFRRDSGVSTPMKSDHESLSPGRRDSEKESAVPVSPFRQEFEALTHRPDSDAGMASRRGSLAAIADTHRVDWSQSDEPIKNSAGANLLKPESKWNLKGRLSSISRHRDEEEHNIPPMPPKSPKPGLLSKFKRQ